MEAGRGPKTPKELLFTNFIYNVHLHHKVLALALPCGALTGRGLSIINGEVRVNEYEMHLFETPPHYTNSGDKFWDIK